MVLVAGWLWFFLTIKRYGEESRAGDKLVQMKNKNPATDDHSSLTNGQTVFWAIVHVHVCGVVFFLLEAVPDVTFPIGLNFATLLGSRITLLNNSVTQKR